MLVGAMLVGACGSEPAPEAAPVRAQPAVPSAIGRWEPTQDGHCLELRDDGTFELTDRTGDHPDTVITGRYVLEGDALRITPERIHQQRWVSRCRKHVYPERDVESHPVLGVGLRTGETTTFTLTLALESLTMCGPAGHCETLRRRPR